MPTLHTVRIHWSAGLLLTIWLIASCITVEKIKTGTQAMDRKQYYVAQQLLHQEIGNANGPEKARKCFMLGEAYRLTNQPSKALEWYQHAAKHGLSNNALYWQLGMMSKQTGKYQQAIDYLGQVESNSIIGLDASREIDVCRQAIIWQNRSDPTIQIIQSPNALGGTLYMTDRYSDGQLIVTADNNATKPGYNWTGRFYSDIYLMNPKTGEITAFPGLGKTNLQRGYATFNSDYTELIFTLCGDDSADENFCKLYSSEKTDGQFGPAKLLSFTQPGINYSHPFLTRDSILFFSANAMDGQGAYDLYYSVKRNNRWLRPVNLPAPINTPGNEKFPTMEEDSLYFSSDYLPGLGGLDIFKTYLRSNGQWSPPKNLMPPFNSPMDDFGYFPDTLGNGNMLGYLNSSRNSSDGFDRIFSLTTKDLEKDSTLSPSDTLAVTKKEFKRFLSLRVVEQIFEDPADPNSRVIGKRALGNARILYPSGEDAFTREDGRYIREIEFDSSYVLQVKKSGYLSKRVQVPQVKIPTDPEASEIQTSSLEVILSKIYIDQEIVLQNIYYDLDQWYIREDAKPVLNQLARDLKDNPNYDVLIAAHTDCRADEAYNMELSEKRARSVVEYLVAKGIAADRLSAIGYGKSRLIENCTCEECTEKQHQKNRRTTFTLKKR